MQVELAPVIRLDKYRNGPLRKLSCPSCDGGPFPIGDFDAHLRVCPVLVAKRGDTAGDGA